MPARFIAEFAVGIGEGEGVVGFLVLHLRDEPARLRLPAECDRPVDRCRLRRLVRKVDRHGRRAGGEEHRPEIAIGDEGGRQEPERDDERANA